MSILVRDGFSIRFFGPQIGVASCSQDPDASDSTENGLKLLDDGYENPSEV
ncbi:MAG: hypothetical protein ACXVIS_03065 [Halobacteriota archaeon]